MLIRNASSTGKSLYARLSRIMELDPDRSPGISESTPSGDTTTISLAALQAAQASAEHREGFMAGPLSLDGKSAGIVDPAVERRSDTSASRQASTTSTANSPISVTNDSPALPDLGHSLATQLSPNDRRDDSASHDGDATPHVEHLST